MANLVSSTIPNLIQGTSLQPDSSRDPSQGDEQINGMSSLAEGLRKREGTECIKKISDADLGDVYMHQILRDSGEKYLVVISKTSIKVSLVGSDVVKPFHVHSLFSELSVA